MGRERSAVAVVIFHILDFGRWLFVVLNGSQPLFSELVHRFWKRGAGGPDGEEGFPLRRWQRIQLGLRRGLNIGWQRGSGWSGGRRRSRPFETRVAEPLRNALSRRRTI